MLGDMLYVYLFFNELEMYGNGYDGEALATLQQC